MKKLGNKGFTLVEVIASVTIIGVLAGSAIYSSVSTFNKAHVDYCTQISDNMVVAARDYFNDFKNVLPADYGIKSCVDLKRLQDDKYIEELKDYEDNTCSPTTSKVCVLKETNETFYYSPILDCHKCITENSLYQDRTEAPTIEFTPNTSQNLKNKDLVVTIKYNGGHKKIVSYSYQLYQKQSGGDVIVGGSTDYRKYNGSDTEIKLNRRGTYYVKATAINEDGTKTTEKSKEFKLEYTLDCTTRKVVTVSAKQDETGVSWEQNVWHNRTLKVTFKRNSGAIDNYSAKIYKYDCTGKATCNPQTTNMKGSGWVLHKTVENATKNKTVTVGKNDANAVYVVEIQGYDTEGGLCSSDKGQLDRPVYYQDNEKPTCPKTDAKVPNAKGKAVTYPVAGRNGWTKETVTLNGVCNDKGGSQCNGSNGKAKLIQSVEYVGNLTPGYVYDIAGNRSEAKCPNVMVKIDQTKPTCVSTYLNPPKDGLDRLYRGESNQWTRFAITLKGACTDPNGTRVSAAKSGCKKTEVTRKESKDQKAMVSPGSFEDYAGNSSGNCPTLRVQIDTQKPTCNGKASEASSGDWNGIGETRTVKVKCTDKLKNGVASGCYTNSLERVLDTEGKTEKISDFVIKDLAGNPTTCPTYTFKKLLDYHKPDCEPSKKTEASNWSNVSNTIKMGCSDTKGKNDGNSGCDSSTLSKTISSEGEVEKNVSFTIADKAGNEKICPKTDFKKLIDKHKITATPKCPTYTNSCGGSNWHNQAYTMEFTATDTKYGNTLGASGPWTWEIKSSGLGVHTTMTGKKGTLNVSKEGKFEVQVRVKDKAGNDWSPWKTCYSYLDKTKPENHVTGPRCGELHKDGTIYYYYLTNKNTDNLSGVLEGDWYITDGAGSDAPGLHWNPPVKNSSEYGGTGCAFLKYKYTGSGTQNKTYKYYSAKKGGGCKKCKCTWSKCTRTPRLSCQLQWKESRLIDAACNSATVLSSGSASKTCDQTDQIVDVDTSNCSCSCSCP